MKFPEDLLRFKTCQKDVYWRLISSSWQTQIHSRRTRDEIMEDIKNIKRKRSRLCCIKKEKLVLIENI